jgi:hypothetical protein
MDIYKAAHRIFHGHSVAMQLVEGAVPIMFTSSFERFGRDSQGKEIKKPVKRADIQDIVTTMVGVLSPRCISSKLWYTCDVRAFAS